MRDINTILEKGDTKILTDERMLITSAMITEMLIKALGA